MELRTTRTLLREFVAEDLAAFSRYRLDPAFRQFAPEPAAEPSSEDLLATFLRWAAEDPRCAWQLAISIPATMPEQLAGTAGLRKASHDADVADFGIELDARYWGRGHASEVARALLDFGFGGLALRQVVAQTVSANHAVAALLGSLRFERSGATEGSPAMQRRGWKEVHWRLPRDAWLAPSMTARRAGVALRPAAPRDVAAMHAVRIAVRENRLTDPSRITPDQYERRLAQPGAAWVAEVDGVVAGFGIADLPSRSIWALFVQPGMEGRGIGRALLQAVTQRLEAAGPGTIHLSTEAGSRAARFYAAAGWTETGRLPNGEIHFTRSVPG